ncbi:MAG TPA: GNAT family N-acetyltransferase [Gemmatimonadaceae bacterium]|nr:GNAT family N-acetyltransferase [Gemmatimonadaceae bacterium]
MTLQPTTPVHLSLARCAIRSWRPDDAPRLARIANDRSIWVMVRDRFPHPYSLADADAHIARSLEQDPPRNLAITVDDVVIGAIGCIPGEDINRVRAEVGYWLGADARGKGYATEALRGFVQWLWDTTEFQHLTAAVFTDNPASARVLEKAGFVFAFLARKCAIKDGVLRDEWNYSLTREDDTTGTAEDGE